VAQEKSFDLVRLEADIARRWKELTRRVSGAQEKGVDLVKLEADIARRWKELTRGVTEARVWSLTT
jgi:hypothetical protein